MSTIRKQSVSEDCVELRLNHKTIGLAPLKGAHIPRIGDFVFLPGNEEPVSATIQGPSTYYEVEKVVLVYGQPDQSELCNTDQPLSAYKSVLHETRACGNAETSAVGLPTRQTSPHDRGEELQVIVKPADRTVHALAKHAEVFFKVYSSIARWWASVRIFSGGRFRRYCLRIGARNRTIRSQVGLEHSPGIQTSTRIHHDSATNIEKSKSCSGSIRAPIASAEIAGIARIGNLAVQKQYIFRSSFRTFQEFGIPKVFGACPARS
jgi:hypothetical protein